MPPFSLIVRVSRCRNVTMRKSELERKFRSEILGLRVLILIIPVNVLHLSKKDFHVIKRSIYQLLLFAIAAVFVDHVAAQPQGLSDSGKTKPVKVFILAGQSNMEGKAAVALLQHGVVSSCLMARNEYKNRTLGLPPAV